jgi:hypothetical protein
MIKTRETIQTTETAIKRGLDFIYRTANAPEGFASYGSLMICCFALVGATSRDAGLRQLARSRAEKFTRRWQRLHPVVPLDANADLALDFAMLRYALSRIGQRDVVKSEEIRAAVQRFSVEDLLGFNPLTEPPPNDLPFTCDCGLKNQRGRKTCKQCQQRLEYQSRYRVWMEALANTYVSERCGLRFGAGYLDVLKWLPTLRPYPEGTKEDVELVRDAIYAVTHVVYALNDYGTYKLSPRLLSQEVAFLKANVASACKREDPEILGELLDTLRALGLRGNHALISQGTRYLLTSQNKDGSWGDPDEENIRTRCHTTWTAIDGLRSYAWRGERSTFPRLQPLLN